MKSIRIKKGLDIHLNGEASAEIDNISGTQFGIVPDDFPGYTWKVKVKAGDKVNAGDPLLYAKESEDIVLTSPVSGEIAEVRRGERRKILAIVVKSDGNSSSVARNIEKTSEKISEALKSTGLWAMMRQRPYDIVPRVDAVPRDIFVAGFDSAPLAPELLTNDVNKWLETGLEALSMLTTGKVYVSVRQGTNLTSNFAEIIEITGPHPSGNAGVMISHIRPVNKGETVWTLDITTVARIGKLISKGELDYSATVAVVGSGIENPHYVQTVIGISVSELLKNFKIKGNEEMRVISGNVLTGIKINPEQDFLRFPYRQVTVIPEGNKADEFMGWSSLNPKKYSVKRTFPAFLRGLSKPFDFDARIKGGHRAMILSGEYDKVFPMDIYPEYLIKAILAKDIDKMEKLGIYEVAPEDFALPEFVDTSKLELQKIVRDGLDYLYKELN